MNPANPSVKGRWPAIAWILLGVLAIRLVHLGTSLDSPLFWKGGPDEEFYRDFGRDVAFGHLGMAPEFAFMDPLYGYLLGGVFWLLGDHLIPVYLLQIVVDTCTAAMLWRVGVALGNERAGVLAAALHGATATALLFSLSLMKATWVAAAVTAWMLLSIRLVQNPTMRRWAMLGVLLGLMVALRANLLLLVAATAVLLPSLAWWRGTARPGPAIAGALLMCAALAPVLGALSLRNAELSGAASITPNNGGVVLHQIYNEENPRAVPGAPSFVAYGHPREIWRAYVERAEERVGRPLQPIEVDSYWKQQAIAYIRAHPGQTLANVARKAGEFIAWPEIPNNRSFEDERRFAPLLRWLPPPFGWLFALGVPGLLILWRRNCLALVPIAAIGMGLATAAVFFAEDRFRFNVITPFTLGAAYACTSLVERVRGRSWWSAARLSVLAAACGSLTLALATWTTPTPMNWERIAWGYVIMGKTADAARWVEQVAADQPGLVGIAEFRGFFALRRGDAAEALRQYNLALTARLRHEVLFNRSLALEQLGDLDAALRDVSQAYALAGLPDYRLRMGQVLKRQGRREEADAIFRELVERARKEPAFSPFADQARQEMSGP